MRPRQFQIFFFVGLDGGSLCRADGPHDLAGHADDKAPRGHLHVLRHITDGRFSGASRGAAIGHVSPEAASGGPIGLVREGDTIEIDIPNASIHLAVSDDELAARKAAYVQPEPNIKTGWLARYARLVTSANLGAVLK